MRAEVYSLNSFLASSLIYLVLIWKEKRGKRENVSLPDDHQEKWLYLLGFLFGLSLGNHSLIIALTLPAFLFYILGNDFRLLWNLKIISITLFFALLGFSVYLYLPLRSSNLLFFDWGNPDNLNNFITVVYKGQNIPIKLIAPNVQTMDITSDPYGQNNTIYTIKNINGTVYITKN